ncbi:CoA-binding protein [Cyclobacterium jeungdonense]|uniref:CoA-binding protein n=1 Tax=Cyclobacterium jeungdonense TaxID=708087 RepID=A0ABT8C0J5_9BACT|nr:CoA-binding protein [Cyclobacterium jeungdonense]MDN3686314.1 CoA-binding protein [Cyclobacterium jeungdonense]
MKKNKKTVILGASPNTSRYAYAAARMLKENDIPFVPVGIKKGQVLGEEILNIREKPPIEDVHTLTLYIGPPNQKEWYDYMISLQPKRIIFNPGTENPELFTLAKSHGIEVLTACNLVMLSTDQF